LLAAFRASRAKKIVLIECGSDDLFYPSFFMGDEMVKRRELLSALDELTKTVQVLHKGVERLKVVRGEMDQEVEELGQGLALALEIEALGEEIAEICESNDDNRYY
jgi:hypothetical protein